MWTLSQRAQAADEQIDIARRENVALLEQSVKDKGELLRAMIKTKQVADVKNIGKPETFGGDRKEWIS